MTHLAVLAGRLVDEGAVLASPRRRRRGGLCRGPPPRDIYAAARDGPLPTRGHDKLLDSGPVL